MDDNLFDVLPLNLKSADEGIMLASASTSPPTTLPTNPSTPPSTLVTPPPTSSSPSTSAPKNKSLLKNSNNDSSSEKFQNNSQALQFSDVPRSSRSHKERFHKNFPDVACSDEMIIKTYHCALVTDILLQGYLYITARWFCFYSKLFGKKKLIKIPLSLVLDVSKKKTAKFIPNAVGVTTLNKEYLFGSLLSRDNTFRVMVNTWHNFQKLKNLDSAPKEMVYLETNDELVSLDSNNNNNIANNNNNNHHSDSTSYEESFSNADVNAVEGEEEDMVDNNVETCNMLVKRSNSRLHSSSSNSIVGSKSYSNIKSQSAYLRRKSRDRKGERYKPINEEQHPFNMFTLLLKLTSLPRTCLFLVIASILTFVLLISACMLSSQLSNLETMFHNIVDENNQHHQLLYQQRRNFNGDGGDEGVEEGEADGLTVDDNCKQRESSMAVIRELSTMHYHLLAQINKILKVLQITTTSNNDSEQIPTTL